MKAPVRLIDLLEDALDSLRAHKSRAALSMLGMVFGVAAVIAMLAIGAGAERQALERIARLGLRNVVVEAKELDREDLTEIRKKSPGLTLRDLEAIESAVPGISWVAPRVKIEPYEVRTGRRRMDAVAYGVSRTHFEGSSFRLRRGRLFDREDERTHAQVAVIDSGVHRELFGPGSPIGHELKVDDVWLTVVGVLEPDGIDGESPGEARPAPTSGAIYLPYTTALRKFEHPPLDSPLDQILVHVESGQSPWETTSILDPLLLHLHGGERDYTLIVPEALLAQSRETQRLFNIVMVCIAGISLLVGGIGIMNIMLASVLERTREIGIRRAVGARRRDLLLQFLAEAFSISFLGGLVGIFVGVAIAYGVSAYAGWPTEVTLASIVLSAGVSVSVGITSGVYPATRASKLHPARALGYE